VFISFGCPAPPTLQQPTGPHPEKACRTNSTSSISCAVKLSRAQVADAPFVSPLIVADQSVPLLQLVREFTCSIHPIKSTIDLKGLPYLFLRTFFLDVVPYMFSLSPEPLQSEEPESGVALPHFIHQMHAIIDDRCLRGMCFINEHKIVIFLRG